MDSNTYCTASEIYMTPDIEGYLTEKKMMRNAKTWCSLQGATLYLQKAHQTQAVVQTIDMATEVQVVKKVGDLTQFEITLKKGKHTFLCSTSSECSDWVNALLKAMSLQSNGVGFSQFHVQSDDYVHEYPYTLPQDDVSTTTGVSDSPESVYEDVQVIQQGVKPELGKPKNQNTNAPTLPSMEARNKAKARNGGQTSNEEVVLSKHDGEEYCDGASVGAVSTTCEQEVYMDASSESISTVVTNSNKQQQFDAKLSSVQLHSTHQSSQPTCSNSNGTQHQGSDDTHHPTVVLRSQSRTSSFDAAAPASNAVDEDDDDDDDENDDEADTAVTDAFAELDQALCCHDTTGLVLECPLVAEDFQPLEQLRKFLANNEYFDRINNSMSDLRPVSMEDPVTSLKVLIQQINL